MNIRTGVDIISVERIKKATQNDRFLHRILTESESKYVSSKILEKNGEKLLPYETIAGLFAAKEAVSKALGTGLLKGIGFADIEIRHNVGAPYVILSEKACKKLTKNHSVSVSIAHDGGFAVASANILEW